MRLFIGVWLGLGLRQVLGAGLGLAIGTGLQRGLGLELELDIGLELVHAPEVKLGKVGQGWRCG